MNVCIIRHSYYPDVPPTRRNAETLTSHGYQVDVICLRKKGQKSKEVINGVTVHRLPIRHIRAGALRYIYEYAFFFILAAWKLYQLSIRRRFKAVEVDAMPDFLVFTTLLLKARGTKVILNMLDSIPEVLLDKYKVDLNNPIIKLTELIENCSTGYADHILFCNELARDYYVIKRRGNGAKVSVVMNVPEENIFHPYPGTQPSGKDNHFRLITHGSLLERYGIQNLIQAVPLLIPNIPEISVDIVGDGEYRPQLQKLTGELGMEKYINFVGFVPIERVPEFIAQADIGIVPILMHMQPTKLFEYVAMDKPVIASDFPAMRDCFDDKAVKYYSPGDLQGLVNCILELYHNPEKRVAMAAASAAIYQKYRWSIMQQAYMEVFDKLTHRDESTA
jgi:glycosyltransferase involved in cell wall biosynthesis